MVENVITMLYIFSFFFLSAVLFFSFFLYKENVRYKRLVHRVVRSRLLPTIWISRKGYILGAINYEGNRWIGHYDFNKQRVHAKDILPKELYHEWYIAIEKVFKTREREDILVDYVASTGERIQVRFELLFYNRNSLIIFEKSLSKIEFERLEAEKQHHIMQALLDNSPIATTVKDLNDDSNYLIWNKGTEILYSATREQLLGNNASVLDEGLAAAFRRTDEETIATGKSSTIQRVKLADGKIHTLSMHKTLFTYDTHRWIISSALDITELEEKKRELELLDAQHRLIQQAIGMISWSWSKDTNTVLWSKREDIDISRLGLTNTMEEFFEKFIPSIHRERVEAIFIETKAGKNKVMSAEYEILDLEGNASWIETYGIISEYDTDGSAKSIVGASYRIDERKKMQQALIDSKEKAEESNRLKSAFLANMSHEIRTPLNAIVGFSNLLAENSQSEENKEYFQIIERNNELLLQLINDILDLSKIEAGDLDFSYESVDINACLKEVASFARMKVDCNIEIKLDCALDTCILYTERNRVMQVVNNFVSNALKHTVSGFIQIGYSIPLNGYIRFYVRDTGKGIPADKIEQIFSRFMQLDSFKQGVGLGLAISKTIIEKMNGEIGVNSVYEEGSEFWFTIPYQPVSLRTSLSTTSVAEE